MEKLSFRTLATETVTIVVGILLALFANARYEAYKERVKTRDVLLGIRAEIEANRESIRVLLPKQEVFRDLLFEKADEGKTLVEALSEINRQVGPRDAPEHFLATWRSAVNMGVVEHMKPEVVRLLARIEYLHEMQDRRLQRITETVYSAAAFRTEGSDTVLRSTALVVGDYLYSQQTLLDRYDDVLALIPEH